MAPSSSDSDSPKSSSSSSSRRRNEEEEEEDPKSNRSAHHPGSPSNAHQSSDESTTSDGVLVEIPHNQDHAQGDDGGVLVNIDGSDLFVDAPEELGSARSVGLEDSVAMVEYGESSGESESSRLISRLRFAGDEREMEGLRDRLDETMAQCRKYKEEREVFGREVSSLRHQLQQLIHQRSSPGTTNEESAMHFHEDEAFMSPTPLHAMVNDCSNIISHLNSIIDVQSNLEDATKGLNSVLHTKEEEVEDLKLKLAESNVCQDVVISYMGSIREVWTESLKESSYEIEKYSQLLSETQQLRQFLTETRPELLMSEVNEFSSVFSIVREELLESKRKQASLLEKISEFEDENRRFAEEVNRMKEGLEMANVETNKTKTDLEQAENKLAAAREKLSIAVTKGKSLVQHRDALKQSLAEKMGELEKCVLELQQKSSALATLEVSTEETKQLLAEKTNELENCLLELQQKSSALEASEASTEEMKQLLAEKTNELENSLLELQQKSTFLEVSEASTEEMKQLLTEKTKELENSMLELQQKSSALEASEIGTEEMKHLLTEKTNELENALLELQQKSTALQTSEACALELNQSLYEKTSELEKCLLELQQKSEALENMESSAEVLKKSLAEKINELDTCLLELKQKSDALNNAETNHEELQQLLVEKNGELEKSLLELQLSSDALEELRQTLTQKTVEFDSRLQELQQIQAPESIVEELKMLLAEKTNELEKCQLELQDKSDNLQTAITTTNELKRTQTLVSSLEFSLSERDGVLKDIEETMQHVDSEDNLFTMAVVDRVKWFVNLKDKFDAIMFESNKIKGIVSSIDLPETISSTELDTQIEWLVKSFTQAKEDIVKLEEEIASVRVVMASHESESSEAHKEIDRLATSLLEVKQEKDWLQAAHDDLKHKYEKIAETLTSISLEKDGPMNELEATSARSLDDQLPLETELLIEKCIATISKRIKTSPIEGEKFEEMQSLLYIKYLELMLCENILQEEISSKSEIRGLSNELRRASEEVVTLRNEKEALQKELERVEEKSSLIREKLSMAVKKGKGLVQEREGFKHSLDEKNSEIKRLKEDLQLQESAIAEYKEQIKCLSAYSEQIQELEADIASLKDMSVQTEKLLLESSNTLQNLVEYIEDMALPTNKTFEKPVEKLSWIAEYIHESEVAKANLQQELEEAKSEATLQASKSVDAVATMESLKEELSMAEKRIHDIAQEKEDMQLVKVNIEEELEKLNGVSSMQACKLEDAYATIKALEDQLGKMNIKEELEKMKEECSMQTIELEDAYATIRSLEDSLAQSSSSISNLEAEKDEIKSKSQQQINALTAKLASNIENIRMLIKDEDLFSLMTEEFRTKTEVLQHMGILIQGLHDQFTSKGLPVHTGFEVSDFPNFSSLQKFEDFISDGIDDRKISTKGLDDATTLSKIVEGFRELLGNWFEGLSRYMGDHIAIVSQDLQITKDEFICMLNFSESLKLTTDKLEQQNRALVTSVNDLKNKLEQADVTTETAIQDRQSSQERLLELERELEALKNICSEMKNKLEDYQAKEDMLMDKEAEISSPQNASTLTNRGEGERLLTEDQMEALIEKVNNMSIASDESKSQIQQVPISSPVDKLFYVLDNFTDLQHMVENLTYEKEDMQLILDSHVREIEHQKKATETVSNTYQDLESKKLDLIELTVGLDKIIKKYGGNNLSEDQKPSYAKGFLPVLEKMMITSNNELEISKSRMQELGAKLQITEKFVDELSTKNKFLEDSINARVAQQNVVKERTVFDAPIAATGSEISEIEDVGALGKNSVSPPAAHVRTLRKGSSNDHLVLKIDSESDRLISALEIDDKGHVFKSLNASGLIPKQGKLVADRVDSFWVSGGRILMNRPRARLGLIAYWIFLHLWLLGTIL